jgi:tetratricopeptide (TPR) repeat protein
MEDVNWTPTLIALGIGAIAGLFLIINLFRRRSAAPTIEDRDLALPDLEAQRDGLVDEIQALGSSSVAMRYPLELQLAAVLRDLARVQPKKKVQRVEAAEASPVDSRAGMKGFLWGVGGAVAVGALVIFVLQTAEPKETVQPQAPAPATAQADTQQDPELAMIQNMVAADPDNLELRVDLAAAHLMRDQMMDVWRATSYVLERKPDHARALAYQALVRFQMGEPETAVEMLTRATTIDPKLFDGWTHLALVYGQMGKLDDAAVAIAQAKKVNPSQTPMLDSFMAELRANAPAPGQEARQNPHPQIQ